MTINGIPVYDAIIGEEGTGMTCISLVDEPAVMSDFVAMAKASPRMMYAVESEEKRLVFGVVMRADFPLYRRTDKGVEYYICLLYTSPSPRDRLTSRMPSSA